MTSVTILQAGWYAGCGDEDNEDDDDGSNNNKTFIKSLVKDKGDIPFQMTHLNHYSIMTAET